MSKSVASNCPPFRRGACAGAPAPPRWNARSARVFGCEFRTGRSRALPAQSSHSPRGHPFPVGVRVCPPIILLAFILVSLPAAVQAVQQSKNVDAHLLRGMAFLDKDRYEEAIKEFSQSVATNPKGAEALYQLG